MPKKKEPITPHLDETTLDRNKVKLGAWLKSRRQELGLTLREAAKAGACSDAWLCQLENATCDVGAVQVSSIPKLSIAYRLPIAAIFTTILRALGHAPSTQT